MEYSYCSNKRVRIKKRDVWDNLPQLRKYTKMRSKTKSRIMQPKNRTVIFSGIYIAYSRMRADINSRRPMPNQLQVAHSESKNNKKIHFFHYLLALADHTVVFGMRGRLSHFVVYNSRETHFVYTQLRTYLLNKQDTTWN